MSLPARTLAGVALLLFLLNGCGPRVVVPGTATPAPPVVSAGPPPTADEVTAFGRRMEAAMRDQDEDAVRDCLRMDNLIDRCVSDLTISPQVRADFRKGAVGGVGKAVAQLTGLVKDGGTCKFLRAGSLDGKPAVLFRLLRADGGVDYLQLAAARHADGAVAAADLYFFTSGEPSSVTIRRIALQLAASLDQGVAGKLSGGDREVLANVTKVQSLQQQVKAGNHHAALATFRSLPPRLQTEKSFQLLGVMAAGGVGEGEYLVEMERYRAAHPNDPSLAMLSIDYHQLRKEYPQCLAAIDTVDRAVGGDAYLDVLRASARTQEGKFAEARAAADKAIRDEPTLAEGYTTAALACVKLRNHAAALDYFRQGVVKAGMVPDFDAMRGNADWAPFAASPPFQQLERWYAARKK